MGRHHSAFEADLSQQYRRAWGQTIGAGFGSRIGLKSHNFKGIVYVTSVALIGTMNSNKSNNLYQLVKVAEQSYRVTYEALLDETTSYDPPSFLWMLSLLLEDLISDFI